MNENNKEWLKELNGEEHWTNSFENRFGERVCIGIDGTNFLCVHKGISFKPTDKEMKELLEEIYGLDYPKNIKLLNEKMDKEMEAIDWEKYNWEKMDKEIEEIGRCKK